MNHQPDRRNPGKTALEIAKLEDDVGKLRAEVERLQLDVIEIDGLFDESMVAQLVEKNAQLSASRQLAEEKAADCAQTLEKVSCASDMDILTQLPNRVMLLDRLAQAIADARRKVFEPFVHDHHATGFNGEGLGLGLTVVRELVEAHGGTVVATSAGPGLGSEFVVKLPLAVQVEGPSE